MRTQSLARRVDALERRVTRLEILPARVEALESQFLQFREEMRGEFSAVRREMRDLGEQLRADLRAEIKAGDEETRHLMRVLHEDVIARLTLIHEGPRSGSPGKRASTKPRRRSGSS